ncbi:MAG: AEC family transporter [Gluconacetobacter diazotrophicus]|nr:AEC family transporter [Gluconacetobacter diazotrophicus]
MTAVLSTLLPVFGLILAGYISGRFGWLGPGATDAINRFVVRLALPAELFGAVSNITRAQIDHPRFLFAYAGAMLATAAIAFAFDFRRPVSRPDRLSGATMEGLAAGYANTAFMGIPLCLGLFGPAGLPPVVLATLLTVCAQFALAIGLMEYDARAAAGPLAACRAALLSLGRNPIVLAPLLGALFDLSGLALPAPLQSFATLLGGATSPCALVAMGLFLFDTAGGRVPLLPVIRVVAAKLVLQPALTAILVLWVFHLPPLWSRSAILISALPVGTGPFMLAKLYEREAAVATRAILLSTVLSLFTVSALLLVLR